MNFNLSSISWSTVAVAVVIAVVICFMRHH
jgi:hypothetical protein